MYLSKSANSNPDNLQVKPADTDRANRLTLDQLDSAVGGYGVIWINGSPYIIG